MDCQQEGCDLSKVLEVYLRVFSAGLSRVNDNRIVVDYYFSPAKLWKRCYTVLLLIIQDSEVSLSLIFYVPDHITPIFHSFCCTVKLKLLRNKIKSNFLVLHGILRYELKIQKDQPKFQCVQAAKISDWPNLTHTSQALATF